MGNEDSDEGLVHPAVRPVYGKGAGNVENQLVLLEDVLLRWYLHDKESVVVQDFIPEMAKVILDLLRADPEDQPFDLRVALSRLLIERGADALRSHGLIVIDPLDLNSEGEAAETWKRHWNEGGA